MCPGCSVQREIQEGLKEYVMGGGRFTEWEESETHFRALKLPEWRCGDAPVLIKDAILTGAGSFEGERESEIGVRWDYEDPHRERCPATRPLVSTQSVRSVTQRTGSYWGIYSVFPCGCGWPSANFPDTYHIPYKFSRWHLPEPCCHKALHGREVGFKRQGHDSQCNCSQISLTVASRGPMEKQKHCHAEIFEV